MDKGKMKELLRKRCALLTTGSCKGCKVENSNDDNACFDYMFEGVVVLTKEEYEELKQRPEKVHNEMEDAMESGQPAILPCKIGDPAYYVIELGKYSTLVNTNVAEIRIVGSGEYIIHLQGTVRKIYLDNSGRNDNAFLSKEDAKAKLKTIL